MKPSRRGLFGLFAGAIAAPIVKPLVDEAQWDLYYRALRPSGVAGAVQAGQQVWSGGYEITKHTLGFAQLKVEGARIAYDDGIALTTAPHPGWPDGLGVEEDPEAL